MSEEAKSKSSRSDLPEGTVTFLFTDIEGSTELLKQLKDQYASLLADQRKILRDIFKRWNGQEVDTQGDAFFYSFPRATEAMNAAVDVQGALAEYAGPEDVKVRVRIGLHTGEPFVEEEGYVGMDVHRAARIAHVGHGGQVLLSVTTSALVRDELPEGVSLIDLGRHRLKDMSHPEHIRQLVIEGLPYHFPPLKSLEVLPPEFPLVPGPVRLPSFLEEDEAVAPRPIFVGRENALTRLDECLDETLSGKGSVVFISGGPGRGKTALLQAFAHKAMEIHPKLLVAGGECSSFTGAADPYLPFKNILSMLTGDLEARWLRGTVSQGQALRLWETMPMTIQTLMANGPDLIDVFVPGSGLLERSRLAMEGGSSWIERLAKLCESDRAAPGELEQKSLFEQYEAVLGRIAQEHPIVLLLDDLQWADSASIHLLFHLGRQIMGHRIMIIGAYRHEELALGRKGEPHPLEKGLAELKRLYGDIWINLSEIHEAKDRAFVDAIVDSEPNLLSGSFRGALYEHTGGHPLFTIELLRNMQERGDIVLDVQGLWAEGSQLDWNVLPARVEGVIEERIGRLKEDLKETLTIASVEGDDFTAQVVGQVQEVSERRILARLSRELEKHHRLVNAQEETKVGEHILSSYRFTHTLFQQYLYNNLSSGERRILHGEVGHVLEQLYAGQTEEIAVQLAHHYSEAKQADQAILYLLMAGDQARTSFAYEEAIDFYERALEILKEQGNDDEAARVLMKLGLTYHTYLDFQNSREAYVEGFDLWQRVGDAPSVRSRQHAPHPLRVSSYTPPTLDPALSSDFTSNNIINLLFSGLVELTPQMDVAPDVAQSWDVLDGGRKYLFHLRKDMVWSDGRPVTARDFEYAWKRILDPSLDSQNAKFLYDIKGAKAFHQKDLRDPTDFGVKAIDSVTLEVELEEPKGYFMHLPAYSPLFPIPEHIVETFGEDWTKPENIVTNGPFTLQDYVGGDRIVLDRNPNYPGRTDGNIQQVEIYLSEDWSSLLQLYETNELDVLRLWGIPPHELNRLRHRLIGEYLSWPNASTYYLGFDVSVPPFNDSRVRRAFAMSIDKKRCHEALQGVVFPAMGGFVPPGIQGHSEGIGLPYDPQQARELLAEAGYPGGRGFPLISAVNFADVAPYVESLQVEWKENLGIEISWQILEWGPYLELIAREPPQLFSMSWGADYPDPDSFLRTSNIQHQTSWQSDVYDNLVAEASCATAQVERMRLSREADKILIEEASIVPMSYFQDHLLVKPWLKKYPVSPFGWLFGKDVILEPH